MEETGLENMTENTEKEKVLSKEAIVAALNERHSPEKQKLLSCLLYTSPSPRDAHESRMPSSA